MQKQGFANEGSSTKITYKTLSTKSLQKEKKKSFYKILNKNKRNYYKNFHSEFSFKVFSFLFSFSFGYILFFICLFISYKFSYSHFFFILQNCLSFSKILLKIVTISSPPSYICHVFFIVQTPKQ